MDKQSLKPQLSLFEAIATGLAAILGAGIFAIIAPAASLAGPAILVSFCIAAFVALCNALSSIQLQLLFLAQEALTSLDAACLATGGAILQAGCFWSRTLLDLE